MNDTVIRILDVLLRPLYMRYPHWFTKFSYDKKGDDDK